LGVRPRSRKIAGMFQSDQSSPADRLRETRCIGLIRTQSALSAIDLGKAMLAGGLRALEVSFTTPDAHEAIAALAADGRGLIGAGTVLEPAQAEAALRAGASFLISPGQPEHVVHAAHAAGSIAILGGLTPVEILAARHLGADFVKVFPIRAVGGPDYVRDVLAPLPDIPILVSGGVDAGNFRRYLAAGAQLCVLGSQLVPTKLLEAKAWSAISDHIRAALAQTPSDQYAL
ncbi:MAG: bifunctional 4-hydroxy-2-oxoglutarate aldolase/2-dehydro-3-deoxy-phosphogluconate aldolase, partial [Cyanobacteria bacterium REEB65]|nr:bifunctional 4-hydroxy-2-oxoglutarate aldolase/2-dehydro-3-deoxy-phosphogluconate aldolase [Cyanobacteria bacterium REEB65]